MSEQRYETVVIDFPWEVHNNLSNELHYRMGKPLPYKSMKDSEILKFPINNFAKNRCDLFLWSITSRVPFCFQLLKEWGFRYMDLLAWDKGVGVAVNGIYRQTEWIIYAYRGIMGLKRDGHIIPSYFREKRKNHSQKPDSFYEILRTNTLEPRIDIFARRRHFGFDSWGDEVEDFIEIPLRTGQEEREK